MVKRKLGFIKLFSLFVITQVLFGSSLFAQGFDQNIFDQIKRQTGSTTEATSVKSPLDQSREQDYVEKLNEQLEARRFAAPSIIENDFNSRLGYIDKKDDRKLTQFGYNIFNRLPVLNQIMTGSVPDTYIVGVGDELIVSFKGSKEEIVSVKVDREGRLIIPSLSPISASGLMLGELRSLVEKQVTDSLIGTEVYLSVATLRQISVLVAGEVENPSLVSTTSLSSPIEVLLHVGGVKKTGSLRNITLQRGNELINIDLYKIMEGTGAEIINLQDGDRLIVPTIGSTVAIDGNVIRPGIYEIAKGKEFSPFLCFTKLYFKKES